MIIEEQKNTGSPEITREIESLRIQLRDFHIFKEENESYRNKFIKDEAYILYLEEHVRSLEDVVNVLSEEQNQLSEKYSLLSTKIRYLSQGGSNIPTHQKDLEIARLQDEIVKLKSPVSYTHLTLPTICSV